MIKITKIKKVLNERINNNLFKILIRTKTGIKKVDVESKKGKNIDFYA
jgi:hypothetical protein